MYLAVYKFVGATIVRLALLFISILAIYVLRVGNMHGKYYTSILSGRSTKLTPLDSRREDDNLRSTKLLQQPIRHLGPAIPLLVLRLGPGFLRDLRLVYFTHREAGHDRLWKVK